VRELAQGGRNRCEGDALGTEEIAIQRGDVEVVEARDS